MGQIAIAFCGEGNSDRYFLPPVIQRTAEDILATRASNFVEVRAVDPIVGIKKQKDGKDILDAASSCWGYDVLVIHRDADACSYEERREQSFEPGKQLIQASSLENLCQVLVPVIPVREVEAWMLADREKLREVLLLKERLQNLSWLKQARLVEGYPDPKIIFNKAIELAGHERRRPIKSKEMREIYEVLAQEMRLERLRDVPAYRKFVAELSIAFIQLNLIKKEYC